MKKIVFFLLLSFSISLFAQENSPDAINDGKVAKLEHSNAKSSTVIWEEDFDNGFPSGWSTYSNNSAGGIATAPWKHTYAGSWGYWNSNQGASAGAAINSTTASNGFLITDPDSANHWNYGQPSGTTYEYIESYFTTSAIDLSGWSNVSLEFQQTFRFNNSLNLKVSISTDSMMWTDYSVQGNATNNQQSSDPQQVSLNISSVAGNSPTVYVRIGWEARVYYWMIDDMQIVETPSNKLELLEANHGGWHTTPTTQGFAMGYKYYPINQAIANPYKFEGIVANLGALNQNTRLNVLALDDIGNSVLTSVSNDTVLSIMDTNIFVANNTFTPSSTGMYSFYTWSSSDSTITDTIMTSSIVTDTVYGRDFNNYESYYRVGRDCGGLVLGTYYDIYDTDDVSSISAYISPISVPGAMIYATVYEVDVTGGTTTRIWLGQSDDYTIQSGDLDNWVTLEIPVGVTLTAGSTYMAAIGGYAHPTDSSAIGMSGEAWPTTCFIQKNGCLTGSQTFGSWYWTSKIPMIRFNMGNSWTSAAKEDVMLGNIIVYPNPVSEKINIESEYKITTPMFINLSNLLGKVIVSREVDWVQNQRTTIDVSNFAKGIYMLEIEINDQIHIQRIVVE
jgi:hypothetical protein